MDAACPKINVSFRLTAWACRNYSSLPKLKMGPGMAIVPTDAAAVKELMDRRSGTTANRPPNHVIEHTTEGLHIALAPSSWVFFSHK
jgi:hypothetical protein